MVLTNHGGDVLDEVSEDFLVTVGKRFCWISTPKEKVIYMKWKKIETNKIDNVLLQEIYKDIEGNILYHIYKGSIEILNFKDNLTFKNYHFTNFLGEII